MNPYENMANAIVVQAVTDYRKALHNLKRNSKYEPSQNVVSDVERFFRSEWYTVLTSISGERLIKMLRQEVA
jgi:hypothetical protein